MKVNLKWNRNVTIVATAVISAVAGAGVGFLASAKLSEKKFQDRLKKEIEETRVYYQNMYSTPVLIAEDPVESESELLSGLKDATDEIDGMPADLVGNAIDAMRSYRQGKEEKESEIEDRREPLVVNNIFEHHTPPGEEVLGALMKDRDPALPYIITKEEFYQNEPDFEQKQFTYYEGDDILVDDQDEFNPIDNTEMVAGDDNLLRFGYGSGDENIVYIRNETLDPPLDLYVTRSSGKYSVEVLAMDDDGPHLQHSKPRKFRIHDE